MGCEQQARVKLTFVAPLDNPRCSSGGRIVSSVHVQWREYACEFRTGKVAALDFTCFWQGVLVTSQQTWTLVRLPASATSCLMSAPISVSFARVWYVPQRLHALMRVYV